MNFEEVNDFRAPRRCPTSENHFLDIIFILSALGLLLYICCSSPLLFHIIYTYVLGLGQRFFIFEKFYRREMMKTLGDLQGQGE